MNITYEDPPPSPAANGSRWKDKLPLLEPNRWVHMGRHSNSAVACIRNAALRLGITVEVTTRNQDGHKLDLYVRVVKP